jgi:phage tail-like protein
MEGDRKVCMLVQPDQWARCAHTNTSLLPDGGVELDWTDDDDHAGPGCGATPGAPGEPAGLVFDRWCSAYRSRPAVGTVEVSTLHRAPSPSPCPGPMNRPRGLAVDRRQRLYIAETGSRSVLVIDLWARRILRRLCIPAGRPVDVAVDCGRVLVLVRRPDALVVLDGRRSARAGPPLMPPRCHDGLQPSRITQGPLVLWTGPGHGVVASPDGTMRLDVEDATDIEVTPDGVLVVARAPGQSFRRFARVDDQWMELGPIGAPDYDGGAVAVTPEGRVAYTVAAGYRTTTGLVARRETEGTVVTYRFDSGGYQTRWGRLFLDACLPPSTSVRARFLTSDDDEVPDPIEATRPARGGVRVRYPELTPALPSRTWLDAARPGGPLFRRPTGREQPWQQIAADDVFETYEAPVAAAPGRYLWVELELVGTRDVTPRVRALRIEHPGHPLLGSLPKSWSRDDVDVDFLQRYLAPVDGILHELDWRSAQRAILLDPRSTPQEALPWLAGFAGLVLDRRWSEQARRTLVAEAYRLFARRGTKAALLRLLEIYLGRPPALVEAWQMRGLGGTVLGTTPEGAVAPAVGGSVHATGTLGRFAIGGRLPRSDSYERSAHRFTILIPGELTTEQRAVVDGLAAVHRPAHTVCDICELGSGMRVGQRLRLSLTAFVGPGAAWGPAVVGQSALGGDGVIGQPAVGARLGKTSVTGKVRVG